MKLADSLWLERIPSSFSRGLAALVAACALGACAEGFGALGDPSAIEGASGTGAGAGVGSTAGSAGTAGSVGSTGGSGGFGGAAAGSGGASGGAGTSGQGGDSPCDPAACPAPPAPFPFVPAPAACCTDADECGAVDLFGGCV